MNQPLNPPILFHNSYPTLADFVAAQADGYPKDYFGPSLLAGTLNDPLLGKWIKHNVMRLMRQSNGLVSPSQLVIKIPPLLAKKLANTQEIRAYITQQAANIAVLDCGYLFGLPNPLYGVAVQEATPEDALGDNGLAIGTKDGQYDLRIVNVS